MEHLLASYGFPLDSRDRLSRVCSDQLLRDKACALVGPNAAQFCDLIHHVPDFPRSLGLHSLTTLPQQHLADVPSQDMLRFLQDICSRSGELPSSLWLKDVTVHREDYIARGGEACIYRGTLGNRKVVVREISKPGSADWTSREGEHVIEVWLHTAVWHAKAAETLVAADQARNSYACTNPTPERDPASGSMERLWRRAAFDGHASR